jgi:hypothetical protein
MCRGDQEETKYLRPVKKATPVRPAEGASHLSCSRAALRRAVACRSPRVSVREHYTLVAQSVEHFGPSLPGRGLRAVRFSCDDHQRGAAVALQLEQDEQDT